MAVRPVTIMTSTVDTTMITRYGRSTGSRISMALMMPTAAGMNIMVMVSSRKLPAPSTSGSFTIPVTSAISSRIIPYTPAGTGRGRSVFSSSPRKVNAMIHMISFTYFILVSFLYYRSISARNGLHYTLMTDAVKR